MSNCLTDHSRESVLCSPIAMPEHGRSRIYEFSLPDNYTYSYQEVTVVPSIEAKDGEFFMVDQALHLVIAHRGNYTLDTKISQSLHLKLERDGFSSTFNVIQGYEGNLKLNSTFNS